MLTKHSLCTAGGRNGDNAVSLSKVLGGEQAIESRDRHGGRVAFGSRRLLLAVLARPLRATVALLQAARPRRRSNALCVSILKLEGRAADGPCVAETQNLPRHFEDCAVRKERLVPPDANAFEALVHVNGCPAELERVRLSFLDWAKESRRIELEDVVPQTTSCSCPVHTKNVTSYEQVVKTAGVNP